MLEYKFKLLKLHCAACALALEQNINQIEGVEANINYVSKCLKLKISTDNPAETLTEVKIAITKFDHMVELVDFEDDELLAQKEKIDRYIKVMRYFAVAVLVVLSFLIKATWLKISLFAISYLMAGYEILIAAAKNVRYGKVFDENFLMAIASIGAFVIGEYFEAVCVVLLYGIGELFEDMALNKSRKTIKAVLEIKQPYANLLDGETESQLPLNEIKIGDIIVVKPGERIPLDGEVIDGTSYLDMSALTGESKEKIVVVGQKVLSGSINGASVLKVRVESLEQDSTVSKIVDMVQNASESKAKTERFISKFSKIYTPVVIALAFVLMFVPPIIFGFHTFAEFAYRALCFLVVSCPCALVISVPLSYFAGIGASARLGVMVKSANFLEALAKVDCVVFDKTGTLTKGDFEISEIFAVQDKSQDDILELAAYAESYSNHKIAKSILKTYKEKTAGKTINLAWINDYQEIAGRGIKANIFMQDVLVGNFALLKENDVNVFEVAKDGTVLYVAVDGKFAGYIVIADSIKPDAADAIKNLNELGITDITLSTGDEESAAKAVCSKIGIKKCEFGLLPEDKVLIIADKVQEGKTVAFVGDGINDAPSLANANVGISMGGFGSDVAVEASDVVIMTDEPSKAAVAVKKAKQTRKILLQNIVGSISIKTIILGLVSFGLAGMWLAVFADVGVSLLAVLNSFRLMINKK